MTTAETADDLADARVDVDVDEEAGPVIGRRRSTPNRDSFTLAAYDARDQEQLHKLTARTDVDASSVMAYVRPNAPTSVKIGAIRSHLFRALVDDDGISVAATVEVVVPHGDDPADAVVVDAAGDDWHLGDLRYRLGDSVLWGSPEEAEEHGRVHGSSLRRFTAIMDDDAITIEVSALEDVMEWFGRQGSGDHPTQARAPKSRSRKTKAH